MQQQIIVFIPANCEKIIDVFVSRLTGDDQQETPVILEPSPEFHERYGLLMASSLSSLNSRVTHKVRLLNPNMYDVSINQDVSLGKAEDIDGLTILHNGENFCPSVSTDHLDTTHCTSENQTVGIRQVIEELIPEHLQSLYENACKDRTDAENRRIAQSLIKFQNTFSRHQFDLGLTHLVEHRCIDVGDHPPIKQAPRRVPAAFAAEEENVIKELEAQGSLGKVPHPGLALSALFAKSQEKLGRVWIIGV